MNSSQDLSTAFTRVLSEQFTLISTVFPKAGGGSCSPQQIQPRGGVVALTLPSLLYGYKLYQRTGVLMYRARVSLWR